MNFFTALKGTKSYFLVSHELVFCRVAALNSSPVNRSKCTFNFNLGPVT